jgi:hypothetical protein
LKAVFPTLTGRALLLPGILAVIWGAVWLHLSMEYRRAMQDGIERTTALSQTLDENMSRSAAVLDAALQNSRAGYLQDKAGFKIGSWMRDHAALMKIALQMSIADASGTVVTASGDNGPPPVNISDRAHFSCTGRQQRRPAVHQRSGDRPNVGQIVDPVHSPHRQSGRLLRWCRDRIVRPVRDQ